MMWSVLNNPALTLQLGILRKLLGLLSRIVKGCVREVNLAQVSCILMSGFSLKRHSKARRPALTAERPAFALEDRRARIACYIRILRAAELCCSLVLLARPGSATVIIKA